MNNDELNAIRARLTSATSGPWFAHADDLIGGWCVRTVDTPPSEGPGEVASFIREEDARFIAAAPADIAALIAEIERLREEAHTDANHEGKEAMIIDVDHIEGPEEAHCCCVPLLRGEIERLRESRAQIVRFLRAEAEWLRTHPTLHKLPPHDALTIVAEAIEAGDYFVLPSTYKES